MIARFNKHKTRLIRLFGWFLVGLLIALSLIRLPAVMPAVPSGDKWMHLISYLLLTYWFLHAYIAHPKLVVLGFVLLGAGLELLQSLTPYRLMEWLDLLMNVLGAVLALVVFRGFKIKVTFLLDNPNLK